MHDTSYMAGSLFASIYGHKNFKVLDVGGQDVNGSLREPFERHGMQYISADMVTHPSVDIVMEPGKPFPFENESFDLVISTSCFEHDPCFWMTFRELCRIVKKSGYIYVNAPSNGYYHTYPGDNWRFYSDAGQALSYWSSQTVNETCWPVKVVETFHVMPKNDIWIDFVCIWKRTEVPETEIVTPKIIRESIGPLQNALHSESFVTKSII